VESRQRLSLRSNGYPDGPYRPVVICEWKRRPIDSMAAVRMRTLRGLLLFLLTSSCSLEHEVSRVAISNTSLTVIVVEDEKSLYRYRIEPPVGSGGGRIIGPRAGQRAKDAPLPTPIITRSGDVVTIDWPTTALRVRIDVVRKVVIDDSNQAG
jgi:hypothetical protein